MKSMVFKIWNLVLLAFFLCGPLSYAQKKCVSDSAYETCMITENNKIIITTTAHLRNYENAVEEDFNKSCYGAALNLIQQKDPNAFRIYTLLEANFFKFWLRCGSEPFGVPTAIHESVHRLSESNANDYSFYLLNGESAVVPNFATYYRNQIKNLLPEEFWDHRVETYLGPPKDSSRRDPGEQGLNVLLDELNAYTHGVQTATLIIDPKKSRMSSYRDGLATIMYYLIKYFEVGRIHFSNIYEKIKRNSDYQYAISKMWINAENVLLNSCDRENLGIEDAPKFALIYSQNSMNELQSFFNTDEALANSQEVYSRCVENGSRAPKTKIVSTEPPSGPSVGKDGSPRIIGDPGEVKNRRKTETKGTHKKAPLYEQQNSQPPRMSPKPQEPQKPRSDVPSKVDSEDRSSKSKKAINLNNHKRGPVYNIGGKNYNCEQIKDVYRWNKEVRERVDKYKSIGFFACEE